MYKKSITILLLCNLWYGYGHTESSTNGECSEFIPIPDPNFEIALFNLGIDNMPSDGQVSMGAIINVIDLDVSNQFISDLSGIENFSALQTLNVSGNNLSNLDLNGLPQLINLYANNNMLNVLDLNNNSSLQRVQVDNNNLFQINIQNLSALVELSVNNNNLLMLEVFNSMNLEVLRATNNMLMNLEVSTLTNLKILDASENSLQSITLDSLVNLQTLIISNNQFSSININFNVALRNLDVQGNQLTSIDLANNTTLRTIRLNNNSLTSANLRNGNNTNVLSVNLTGNSGLTCVFVDDTAYSQANWTNIDAQTLFTSTNYCRYTAIPDINFETALESLTYDDISGDGQVPTELIENVISLNLSSTGTSNLTGIEDFTALENFELNGETIQTVNLSSNLQLKTVEFNESTINNFFVDNNPLLESIEFDSSNEQSVITSLNLSNSPLLKELDANRIGLVNLTLPNNIQDLEKIFLEGNNLETLNLSSATSLTRVLLSDNPNLNYLNLQNGNNTNVVLINLLNIPNLTCVLVDDATYSSANWTVIDNQISFSDTYCRYTAIPDINFEAALEALGYDDITTDGRVPTALIENILSVDLRNASISNLTGIQDFTALRTLRLTNNSLTSIDLSQNLDLDFLWCNKNSLTSLDLSNNTGILFIAASENAITSFDATGLSELTDLSIWSNQLSNINLTGAVALRKLNLFGNSLTELDVSSNALLKEIGIRNNSISSLDLTNNTALTNVDVRENGMTYLNVKNGFNINITNFRANSNSNLNCILVDDVTYSTTNWANIDATTSFNDTYCRYTEIPDINFELALEALGYDDISGDGRVPTRLIETVDYLDLDNKNISNITGIEDFTALDDLYINNNNLTSLDLSNNLALKFVFCQNNNLTSINISTNTLLEHADFSGNNLASINVTNNLLLESLNLSSNPIENLNITNNTALEELYLTNTNLTALDLSTNTGLYELEISGCPFETIDLSALSQLSALFVSDTNLIRLDVTNNPILNEIEANNTPLTFVNLKNGNNTNLSDVFLENTPNLSCVLVDNATYSTNFWTDIDSGISFSDTFCRYTLIPDANFEAALETLGYDDISNDGQVPTALIEVVTSLELSNSGTSDLTGIEAFTALEGFTLFNETIATVNLSSNTQLKTAEFNEVEINNLVFDNNPSLEVIEFDNFGAQEQSSISSLDLTNSPLLVRLDINDVGITDLILPELPNLTTMFLSGNNFTSLDASSFTSLKFISLRNNSSLSYLNLKNGNNTNIFSANLENIPNLSCILVDDATYSTTHWTNIDITTSFSDTYCRYTAIPDPVFESELGSLAMDDIPNDGQVPTALIENVISLDIDGAGITDITGIEAFVNLEELTSESNFFTSIDLSNLTKLKELTLYNCPITSIDVSTNVLLENLFLENAVNLGVLDLSTNTELINLDATNCGITTITFTTHDNLLSIVVPQNELTNLDLSSFSALARIEVNDNNLSLLNGKNGNNGNLEIINFTNNPNLTCILVDDAANANANWTSFKDATATYNDISCTNDFSLAIKVYLQGAALNPNTGEQNLMRDDLRVAGYLPTTSPYADGISCEATMFDVTGDDAIVDWIWVELRDATNNTTVSYSRSALLQRDGDIVDVDGVSLLDFSTLEDTYYVVVNHRSHLGIISANTMTFTTGTMTSINFASSGNASLFGNNALTTFGMPTEVYGMWCGNTNGDTVIQYSGTTPDTPTILSAVLNDPGNFLNFPTYSITGYNLNDANMDGVIQYSGTNPDTPFILQNVLAHPRNFLNFSTYQVIEQLPENLIQQ